MNGPLVSVICLCYNHDRFVREAVQSVLSQTYPRVELIIVDDASTDNSRQVIVELIAENPAIRFLPLDENQGNCSAFNQGLRHARGEYVVDLAADDCFVPERIEKQIRCFEKLGHEYGVVFTDAQYIDESGRHLNRHFAALRKNGLLADVPQGDVYAAVLEKYFICAPTMLVRREVFEFLDGYDESLAYEDFDFWVRSARHFKYAYIDEALTLVRRTGGSLSTRLYRPGDRQAHSTFVVCEKAWRLNKNAAEHLALVNRLRYEMRQCALTGNRIEAGEFFGLLKKCGVATVADGVLLFLARLPLSLRTVRAIYLRFKYGTR